MASWTAAARRTPTDGGSRKRIPAATGASTPGSSPTPRARCSRSARIAAGYRNKVELSLGRSGDGEPDLFAWFEGGRLDRVEQDTDGGGCTDLKQWFDAEGQVRAEYRDTTGNCKSDTWSYFKKSVLVRQGLDTNASGSPDVLNHYGPDGTIKVQEVASGGNGRNPDQKLFVKADGTVTAQCLLNEAKDLLNTRAVVRSGTISEILIDTTGDRFADTRQILGGDGQLTKLYADTNGDRKPDVVQVFEGGQLLYQDEDTNFDGVVDQRFQGSQAVAVPDQTRVASRDFAKLGCGSFSGFWWKR